MSEINLVFFAFREGATLPTKGTSEAAGYDVTAVLDEPITIHAHQTYIIPTGLNVYIEPGFEVQARSRSGLAAKKSLLVLNSPGTIDSDYFGVGEDFEIKVILHNAGQTAVVINPGDRVAQLVPNELPKSTSTIESSEVAFKSLKRNSHDRTGGLGSTGVQTI